MSSKGLPRTTDVGPLRADAPVEETMGSGSFRQSQAASSSFQLERDLVPGLPSR